MGPLQEYRLGAGRPSIVITAGIHGNEQTAIYAAELIYSLLQKETLLGEVCILPRCNPSAIRARERKAPEDGLDLNRSFPGAPDGSHTQRLAYEIWRQTEGFDYVLDLHCCGLYGTTYAMHYFKKFAFAKPLCKMLGVPHVVSSKGTRGQLYIESCEQRGQKGILIELPGGQPGGVIYEDAAEAIARQVLGYLRNLNILAGEKPAPVPIRYFDCRQPIRADRGGLVRPAAAPGDVVRQGDAVAYLDDQPVLAPSGGLIAGSPPLRYVCRGEDMLRLAPDLEE